jgi:hypothetical protein
MPHPDITVVKEHYYLGMRAGRGTIEFNIRTINSKSPKQSSNPVLSCRKRWLNFAAIEQLPRDVTQVLGVILTYAIGVLSVQANLPVLVYHLHWSAVLSW